MSYVVIPMGDGCISHSNVNPDDMNLPAEAEIYEDESTFVGRLDDFV